MHKETRDSSGSKMNAMMVGKLATGMHDDHHKKPIDHSKPPFKSKTYQMGCAASTASDDIILNGKSKFPVYGSDLIMSRKAHGTSETPVQSPLRWDCDVKKADKICNFNRHLAEPAGTF
jgi:hypothetical protein